MLDGVAGDFYLDLTTLKLHGPKTTVWPAGVTIRGTQGDKGDKGDNGDKGDAGDPGAGATYLSSSGTAADLSASFPGAGTVAVLPVQGMGNADGITLVGGNLDTTTLGISQIFPRDTTLTSLSARLSFTLAAFTPIPIGVTAQLYTGPDSSNILSPVAGATCTTMVGGFVSTGTVVTCEAPGLSIPISKGQIGVIVFQATSFGPPVPIQAVLSASLAAS